MQIKVSVVIPNYNGKEYLEDCLDALMRQDVRSFEIIVVDDASSDNSLEEMQKKYPENDAFPRTRYIRHEINCGFCKSVNDGIDASKGDYVILLNNDTVAQSSFVRELYQAIRVSDKIFSASAKMLSMQNPELMDDGGDYYCALGWAYAAAKNKPEKNYNKKKHIFASCGGAAIYRKDLLLSLGKFDENHFAYLEDIDIGYRARLHGYVNIFAPKAVVLHAGSATSGSRYNRFKAHLTAKNNIYLLYKNMPNWQIALNFPLLSAGVITKIVFYIFKGMGNTYCKGLIEGFALCKSSEGKAHRLDFKAIGGAKIWAVQWELLKNTVYRLFA